MMLDVQVRPCIFPYIMIGCTWVSWHAYMYVWEGVFTYKCVYVHACMYVSWHVYMCVYMYVYVYVYMYVYVHVCVYTCVYTCVYIYMHESITRHSLATHASTKQSTVLILFTDSSSACSSVYPEFKFPFPFHFHTHCVMFLRKLYKADTSSTIVIGESLVPEPYLPRSVGLNSGTLYYILSV